MMSNRKAAIEDRQLEMGSRLIVIRYSVPVGRKIKTIQYCINNF